MGLLSVSWTDRMTSPACGWRWAWALAGDMAAQPICCKPEAGPTDTPRPWAPAWGVSLWFEGPSYPTVSVTLAPRRRTAGIG